MKMLANPDSARLTFSRFCDSGRSKITRSRHI